MTNTARTARLADPNGAAIFRAANSALHLITTALLALAVLLLGASPALSQSVETFDPDEAFSQESGAGGAIDADLADPRLGKPQRAEPQPLPPLAPIDRDAGADLANGADTGFNEDFSVYSAPPVEGGDASVGWSDPANGASVDAAPGDAGPSFANVDSDTYGEDDLIGAAEGVFGKGAEGLARMIEDLLKKEGKPNGYIVGREAGGAFIVGARYGSGTLHHKVEGKRKVYWTGPSVGFDAGANAANTFVLVYNLYDSEDLFKRYPAGEGQAYFIGGLNASYMRRGDVVLIPIRLGAGVRLGINAGYMKFSKEQRWLPF